VNATFHKRLVTEASAPYRPAGAWAWHFARGKLGGDPLFAALLAPGLLPSHGRYLDLGCGQGLLAAWLLAAARLHDQGQWPADLPPPPRIADYQGVELLAAAVRRARTAFAGSPAPIRVSAGDMCTAPLPPADVVSLIDVLHYIPADQQEALLRRIHACLGSDGRLLLRVGDAAAGLPYRLSRLTDSLVVFAHCGRFPQLHGRPLGAWLALLQGLGFCTETRPMGSAGFANTLILARPA
jgi:SAM-dependent methyltransferase